MRACERINTSSTLCASVTQFALLCVKYSYAVGILGTIGTHTTGTAGKVAGRLLAKVIYHAATHGLLAVVPQAELRGHVAAHVSRLEQDHNS